MVKKISAGKNQIKTIKLEHLPPLLEQLYLDNNNIEHLPNMEDTSLTLLSLEDNKMDTLPKLPKTIRFLNIRNTHIRSTSPELLNLSRETIVYITDSQFDITDLISERDLTRSNTKQSKGPMFNVFNPKMRDSFNK